MKEPVIPLSDIADEVKIGFNITADATEDNLRVHNQFRVFCHRETNGDYTQGLKQLLSYSVSDWKYEMLYERITRLEELVDLLMEQDTKTEEEGKGVF